MNAKRYALQGGGSTLCCGSLAAAVLAAPRSAVLLQSAFGRLRSGHAVAASVGSAGQARPKGGKPVASSPGPGSKRLMSNAISQCLLGAATAESCMGGPLKTHPTHKPINHIVSRFPIVSCVFAAPVLCLTLSHTLSHPPVPLHHFFQDNNCLSLLRLWQFVVSVCNSLLTPNNQRRNATNVLNQGHLPLLVPPPPWPLIQCSSKSAVTVVITKSFSSACPQQANISCCRKRRLPQARTRYVTTSSTGAMMATVQLCIALGASWSSLRRLRHMASTPD